ncbi:MAG: DUF3048 domain-containing protein [Patescibacteria group bacterium]|nr:DUF3048 domain-containing protein [Patescibacteria group bacterium]MDD5121591.1 DUF3048 domain-containing protein [Patescibacteria group bacterium]MDD5222224.1 DUF3048 domain-containing protein [Patescibacteria group bacterium]MDD5396245.1 DUF3048 domain-containing protein [Patescibacteria group bacterium]
MKSYRHLKRNDLVLFGLIFILPIFLLSGCTKPTPTQIENQEPIGQPNSLDGEYVSVNVDLKPVAVCIDNFFVSRPQSGLNQASIVYELPVEANISRFLAVYRGDKLPDKIGPVRSARPYSAAIADEYRAVYVHAGGSPQALSEIAKDTYWINNIDGLTKQDVYFWRDKNRQAPYNLYTSENQIAKFKQDNQINNIADFTSWLYVDFKENGQDLSDIKITGYFEPVVWSYNIATKKYERFLLVNGQKEKFIDDNNVQISASNVIVLFTKVSVIDKIGRKQIDLVSGGKASVFNHGVKTEGTWEKKNNRTIFLDASGQEIPLMRGNTWVEIISAATGTLSNL